MLNEKEKNRYSRQITLTEIGQAGQLKLKLARVLVIGAGGLGCPALQYLAAAGVGTIGIVDFDTVEESNLQRQVLYDEDDIGKYKTEVAAKKIRKQNSSICVVEYFERLDKNNVLSIFPGYHLVLDCSDNFGTRYLVNDACVISRKPFVYGAIHRYEGQISVFNYSTGNKLPVTYRCLFPVPPADDKGVSCADTGVLGVLPGIIGTIMATEGIKIITGIGEVLNGKLLLIDLLSMNNSILELERNPKVELFTPATEKDLKNTDYDYSCIDMQLNNEITSSLLLELLERKEDIQIIDVRQKFELPNVEELSALVIPLDEIETGISQINREKRVIVFCNSGNRSARAISLLVNKYHFSNVYNLKGGIDEWLRYKKEKPELQ